jgi:hypothetical protein
VVAQGCGYGSGNRKKLRIPVSGERRWVIGAHRQYDIRRVLKAAGVEFIDENGGGPGVRLRDAQPKQN